MTNRLAALDVIDASLDALDVILKAFGDEAGAFGSELDALAQRAWRTRRENIKPSFVAQMKDLLTTYLRASYIEGLTEGGLDESDMDAADERAIANMYNAQLPYVDGFAAAVIDARDEADLRDEIDTRILYWAKSIKAASLAGLNSAKASEVVIFEGQLGNEACPECVALLGARHKRSWFVDRGKVPGIPGNCLEADGSGFSCCGYNCSHTLAPIGAPLKR